MRAHCILAASVAVVVMCIVPSLQAADRFWYDPLGGPFSVTSNWAAVNGGANGASVPGAADVAYFLLDETYTVTFSAAPTNLDLDVSDGNVTFDLNGFTYTVTSPSGFSVGRISGETGRLTVRDGILTVDNTGEDAIVGLDAGSIGFLTVTADGRIGDVGVVRPSIVVGFGGTGTLTVNDNGRIDSSSFNVGSGFGAVGTATITGPSAWVDASGPTNIGSEGAGTVNVTNGGTLTTGTGATVGGDNSGNGAVTVSGLGSSWAIAGTTIIGQLGDGALTVNFGGFVSSLNTVTLGNSATGFGTATVSGSGSRWELTSTQVVGSSGLGVLTVSGGGEIVSASSGIIGSQVGSEGRATVTGAGSRWALAAPLTVGSSGSGELTISAGGEVSTSQVIMGNVAAGSGLATVTGAGSRLVSAAPLIVANNATATLRVISGGEVEVGTTLILNDPAGGAVGTLDFDGGLIAAGSFSRASGAIFNWSDGILRLTNGTYDNAGANLTINGAEAGDLPTLQLAGSASGTGFGATTLTVGSSRAGALQITGSATLGVSNLFLGSLDGGSGVVTVSGNEATLTASSTVAVGGSDSLNGGAGTLSINSGAAVTTNNVQIWGGGNIHLNGGTLQTLTFDSDAGAFHFNSGTVRFTGGGYSGAFGADYDALLGFEHRLSAGRRIEYDGAFSFASMNLTVDGGSLSTVGGLTVSLNSILEVRGGSLSASTLTNTATGQVILAGGGAALTTTFSNAGDLRLAATSDFSLINGAMLMNTGLIHGNGQIGMGLTNNSAGQVRVAEGERMAFTGVSSNNGTGTFQVSAGGDLQFTSTLANSAAIDVIGGTLRVEGTATNAVSTGRITARDAILRFNGGLTNNGSLALSFGTSDVFGDITNTAVTGRIVISGGSNATFYDDLVNSGAVQVSLGATAVYFGDVSGPGSFPGAGTNYFEGDLSPGASPAIVSFGGNLVLGAASSLNLEFGGITAGSQFDKVSVAGIANIGGSLDLALISGFKPQTANVFEIISAGSLSGRFVSVSGENLGDGFLLNPITTAISLSLLAALPGDANFDQTADFADLGILLNNYNDSGFSGVAQWNAGDFNDDHIADFADLGILLNNYNKSVPQVAATAPVPEPSTLMLGCFGLLVLLAANCCRRVRT